MRSRPMGRGSQTLCDERNFAAPGGVGPRLLQLFAVGLALALWLKAALPARADDSPAGRAAAAAKSAGDHNRNAEAVILYRQAIAVDPSRRQEWLWKLAEQMTWAHREKEAIPLFREALEAGLSGDDERWARLRYARALRLRHRFREALRQCDLVLAKNPSDDQAREARLGRAETLAWWDKRTAAKKEYEALLRREPGNEEARRKLGQLQSWRELNRDAVRRLELELHDHPADPWGTLFLAQAQNGMGRPDRAKQTLVDFLAVHPAETLDSDSRKDIRHLLEELQLHERPNSVTDYQVSHQSDHLTIATVSLSQDAPLNDGRTTVGPRFQRYDYNPEGGQSSILVRRPGVYGRHRLNDATELTGNLYIDFIEPQGDQKNRTALTYDVYATLWPNDRFRFDVGSNRTTFDNIQSLSRGITGTYGTIDMDYLPEQNTRFTTRANWGGYSDGNTRRWAQFELEHRVWEHPNFLIGARYTTMGFSEMLEHGYYNPSTYRSGVATFHLWGRRGSRFYYDFDGSYGRESANPGGSKPNTSGGAHLTYLIGKRWEIQARYTYFSSVQASSGGFSRRTTGIYLRFVM